MVRSARVPSSFGSSSLATHAAMMLPSAAPLPRSLPTSGVNTTDCWQLNSKMPCTATSNRALRFL